MFFWDERMNNGLVDENNQTYMFEFERKYNEDLFMIYMREHWSDCLVYSALYLVLIFGIQTYMKTRERFDLRPFLATWSGLLAVFSIFGTFRTIPEMALALSRGFEFTSCDPTYQFNGRISSVWTGLFVSSKVIELGDTLFIVLRKQRLMFLHWYHHITVLCYVWLSYPIHIGPGRWFMVMNYSVHSFMYSYYALRAMRFQFPKWVNIFITSLQLLQMVVGVTVNVKAYLTLEAGRYCANTRENIFWCLLMYASYLVLFAHFFYTAYIVKKPVHEKKQ